MMFAADEEVLIISCEDDPRTPGGPAGSWTRCPRAR